MLTQEEDVEIHALAKRGWTISEIARHTGRDRKTIRAYLAGVRQLGVRVKTEEDPFDRVEAYVRQRLTDDHGVWATVLFDEVQDLGYDRSYPTFTRKIRPAWVLTSYRSSHRQAPSLRPTGSLLEASAVSYGYRSTPQHWRTSYSRRSRPTGRAQPR